MRKGFNKEREALKMTQVAMKMKLKTPVTQLENSEDGFTTRRNQAEDRILVPKDKEDQDQINNKHKKYRKGTHRKCGIPWKTKPLNDMHSRGRSPSQWRRAHH